MLLSISACCPTKSLEESLEILSDTWYWEANSYAFVFALRQLVIEVASPSPICLERAFVPIEPIINQRGPIPPIPSTKSAIKDTRLVKASINGFTVSALNKLL